MVLRTGTRYEVAVSVSFSFFATLLSCFSFSPYWCQVTVSFPFSRVLVPRTELFCFLFLLLPIFFVVSFSADRLQVALGARLGIVSEAVAIAAVLSATSTPFHRASHLVHGDPDECNRVVGQSFVSYRIVCLSCERETLCQVPSTRNVITPV